MDYNSRKVAVFETEGFRNCTVAAGRRHTVALKSDGTVIAVGDNKYGQCDVSDWSHIVAVDAVMFIWLRTQVMLIPLVLNLMVR